MPSSWHDTVVQMIRADPGVALRLAREWAGADLPAGLAARGLQVTDEQQARITGCADLNQLTQWVARAAVVQTAAELFADAPAPLPGPSRG